MKTQYLASRRFIFAFVCASLLCFAPFSARAFEDEEEEDSTVETSEEVKSQIAALQSAGIPKTEFEIQAEITETKPRKARVESMAKMRRRLAKRIKDSLANPETQPAKRKSQLQSVRGAFDEKLKSGAPMELREFNSIMGMITTWGGDSEGSGLSESEREGFKALEAMRMAVRQLKNLERLKSEEVKKFRDQFFDDEKMKLYETAIDSSARISAARASKIESLAADEESLAKAFADRLNKLSDALAGQAKNQAKVVNALVEKLPFILGILCALFAVIILLVRFFPNSIQIEWVSSGQVIQLLTVVTLLLIILCLSVTDILKENTIGTLLGGIGGYVLSQGIGRAAARAATRVQQNVEPDNPAPA